MFEIRDNRQNYRILWDQLGISPSIQLKFGIKRRVFQLSKLFTNRRDSLHYINSYVELKGKWDNSPEFGSLLMLKLKNISDTSIRLARLVFPAENGLDNFLKGFKPGDISFLRNGYQSWSTSRSYRLFDKPLRPWIQLVSLVSSNMANLPSNTPGNLSSEMFCVISDLSSNRSFLVGQATPFNQFFYIRLNFYRRASKTNHFELVYDFGRKMILPGETVQLDGIIMAQQDTPDLLLKYFNYIKEKTKIKTPANNIKGYSSWYYYYRKVTPEIIYKNLSVIKEKNLDLKVIQIDDGYQKMVGDWLDLDTHFKGKMKELAEEITKNNYVPGIWIAPFISDKKSELVTIHPEYILRNEYGRPIICGYNPVWKGRLYYGLDITHPRFEEYIRKVIRTIVHEWGFKYLKLDFLFAACIRGGTHHELCFSRAEILKYGLKVIREEAGNDVIIDGCGMPLSTGIGNVNLMRIGPDTASYWKKWSDFFFHTQAMIGAKNSIRNILGRSFINKTLWINDPDCLMVRKKKTRLNRHERLSQINIIILSGSALFYSDNLTEFKNDIFFEMKKINSLSDECFKGEAIALDLMEKGMPELFYNTAGYLGIFNFLNIRHTKKIYINDYSFYLRKIKKIIDVWNGEKIETNENGVIVLKNMPAHSSRLFRVIKK